MVDTESIQYIGEHLWPGRIGQPAVFLSFCAAILSSFAYFMATQRREEVEQSATWRRLGRWSFGLHGGLVFLIIGLIFYVMINNYYEYQYVQAHVNDDLQFRYIFSAFWEGQEGSFLLWMFWHVVLGGLLIWSAGRWESPVLSVVAGVQVILSSMLLGVYFGFGDEAYRIGSNPLLLLRDTMDAPIFANAEYVSLLEGTGLNPLLQNWWMTVHPPTLFLGFASTIVPFAFAIAGLWTKDHKGWLKPALPWALMSGGILGTGILMGGAWAYEALSFGGYWAWDPVENMSLVPWLLLIAGIHTHLVARATGQSIRSTYFFYGLTFVFIVYSTYLTRSGVLGDTSVHAFTEMGLGPQLLLFIFAPLLVFLGIFFWRYRGIPVPAKEESINSKEFWMFIGSLVLLFSAVLISVATSLPVYNKIAAWFDPGHLPVTITDPVPHFNKYQLWIGVFVALLSGFSQFLRWREGQFDTQEKTFFTRLGISIVLAVAATWLTTLSIDLHAWQYVALMFTGWFAVFTNLDHIIYFLKGNMKIGGSALSHIGFGLMIVGILFSGLNQKVISKNLFIMDGLTADEDDKRNTVLLIRDAPLQMGEYELTYRRDTIDYLTRTYYVDYKRRNKTGQVVEEFQLEPNILYDKSFSKVAAVNPSTRHYWNRDVFTHIVSLPPAEMDIEEKKKAEAELKYTSYRAPVGSVLTMQDTVEIKDLDTTQITTFELEVLDIERGAQHPDYDPQEGDLSVGVKMRVTSLDLDSTFIIQPVVALRGQVLYTFPEQINPISTRVRLNEDIFDQVYTAETALNYAEHRLRPGETAQVGELQVKVLGLNKDVQHPSYERKAGDVVVGARLQVVHQDGRSEIAEPIFLIRDNRPLNLKDEVESLGFHARFASLDPGTGAIQLFLAHKPPIVAEASFSVAHQTYRTDWIALQAKEFPGINYFWIGTTLMMIGLTLSMYHRISVQGVKA
ncbi:MAG: cytochrome c biogenesis protein CcsA [Bacteroidota bacterium]